MNHPKEIRFFGIQNPVEGELTFDWFDENLGGPYCENHLPPAKMVTDPYWDGMSTPARSPVERLADGRVACQVEVSYCVHCDEDKI